MKKPDIWCPECHNRVVRVGQFDKLVYWGLGGTIVMALAGWIVAPGFYSIIPLWWFGCLIMYLSRPLFTCDHCGVTWDPRKESGPRVLTKRAD